MISHLKSVSFIALDQNKRKAFQLILLFGLVSLFGDIIYEGARSVNGLYLKVLGANALAVIIGIAALELISLPFFFAMKREVSRTASL